MAFSKKQNVTPVVWILQPDLEWLYMRMCSTFKSRFKELLSLELQMLHFSLGICGKQRG